MKPRNLWLVVMLIVCVAGYWVFKNTHARAEHGNTVIGALKVGQHVGYAEYLALTNGMTRACVESIVGNPVAQLVDEGTFYYGRSLPLGATDSGRAYGLVKIVYDKSFKVSSLSYYGRDEDIEKRLSKK